MIGIQRARKPGVPAGSISGGWSHSLRYKKPRLVAESWMDEVLTDQNEHPVRTIDAETLLLRPEPLTMRFRLLGILPLMFFLAQAAQYLVGAED